MAAGDGNFCEARAGLELSPLLAPRLALGWQLHHGTLAPELVLPGFV